MVGVVAEGRIAVQEVGIETTALEAEIIDLQESETATAMADEAAVLLANGEAAETPREVIMASAMETRAVDCTATSGVFRKHARLGLSDCCRS